MYDAFCELAITQGLFNCVFSNQEISLYLCVKNIYVINVINVWVCSFHLLMK